MEHIMRSKDLTNYLDEYLRIGEVPDYKAAYNGLQVEGVGDITSIAVAVDACLSTINSAVEAGVDMIVVHHGLFWGANAPICGIYYRRLAALLKNDIGLYSCHLPLDVHPEVGNNHVLARKLGLTPDGTFAEFEGTPIGVTADADTSLSRFVQNVRDVLNVEPKVIACGPAAVRRVGILTGGGGSAIEAAVLAGIDTFLTGEGNHHTYFEAEERGINIVYAGHYATETVGVRALGDHLAERFGLNAQFIDHPTGL